MASGHCRRVSRRCGMANRDEPPGRCTTHRESRSSLREACLPRLELYFLSYPLERGATYRMCCLPRERCTPVGASTDGVSRDGDNLRRVPRGACWRGGPACRDGSLTTRDTGKARGYAEYGPGSRVPVHPTDAQRREKPISPPRPWRGTTRLRSVSRDQGSASRAVRSRLREMPCHERVERSRIPAPVSARGDMP